MRTSCRGSHVVALSVREIVEIHCNGSECTEFLLSLVKVESGLCCKHRANEIEVVVVRNWRWAPRSNKRNRWPLDYNFGKFRARCFGRPESWVMISIGMLSLYFHTTICSCSSMDGRSHGWWSRSDVTLSHSGTGKREQTKFTERKRQGNMQDPVTHLWQRS